MSVSLFAPGLLRSVLSGWHWPAAALGCALLLGMPGAPTFAASGPSAVATATAGALATQADAEPSLGEYLDAQGYLHLPPEFSGSVDPAGYRIISGEGEALRFALEAVEGGASGSGWTGFGGIATGCNGSVNAVALDGGSGVYVGGLFTLCGDTPATNVARFDTATQTWAPLSSGAANGVNGEVHALAVSGSTIYVGGLFSNAGGGPANNVARFDTTTQSWPPLGIGVANGVNNLVSAIAVSDGKVYVGGEFSLAGSAPANRVARFDTTTQTWAPLGSGSANGVNNFVFALAVRGGEVYVGGSFTQAGGAPASSVARFNTTAQTWAPLGSGAANGVNGAVRALAVSSSTIYVGGVFLQAGGAPANRVARFDTTTVTWASLGSGAANGVSGAVNALAASGSSVYVGGAFTQAGGAPANRVARFDTTTQTWASVGSGAANEVNGTVTALAVSGGSGYVGGHFTQVAAAPANRVARFDTTTQTWDANGVNSSVRALVVSGSSVYVAGDFTQAGGVLANRVVRFDTTTQTWTPLGSGAANGVDNVVRALAVSGSHVYVVGAFTLAGGAPANRVARFDTTTQTWAPLGSGAADGVNSQVSALAVSGSHVYVGGSFTQAGGAPANFVARFDITTQTWAPLGSGAANGVSSSVNALVVSDSHVYVGGGFTQAGGATANAVARFATTTQTWAPLGNGATNGVNGVVNALALSGSSVYVGGIFDQAGGAPANFVACFDTTTQIWVPLGSGAANGVNNVVRALTVSGSTVYAGGGFTQAGGAPANAVARFDTTAQTWASLGTGATNGVGGQVNSLATVAGGTIFVGGSFGSAGGQISSNIARYSEAMIFSNGFE